MNVQEGLTITGIAFLLFACILGFILVLSLGTPVAMGLSIAFGWCAGMAGVVFRLKYRLGKEEKERINQ